MRPRIQATISQKAYDILIDGLTDPESPLFNRLISRAVDTIILEWSKFPEIREAHQKSYVKLKNKIKEMEQE